MFISKPVSLAGTDYQSLFSPEMTQQLLEVMHQENRDRLFKTPRPVTRLTPIRNGEKIDRKVITLGETKRVTPLFKKGTK